MATPKRENIANIKDYGQLVDEPRDAIDSKMLSHIGKVTSDSLRKLITHMLDKTEDHLFTQAEFAENDSIQTLYENAQREMHHIRVDIQADFMATFQHQVCHGLARKALIDDFDEQPAITPIVSRVRNECSSVLSSLDHKFGILLRDPVMDTLHNPLGPEALCEALRIATKRVETGKEFRLLVFKLFDQHVAIRLREIYEEAETLMSKLIFSTEKKPTQPVCNTSKQIKTSVKKKDASDRVVFLQPVAPPKKAASVEQVPIITSADSGNKITATSNRHSEKVLQGQQRLDEARSSASEVINLCNSKGVSMDFVRDFISSQWKEFLYVTCAQHGRSSAEWDRAVNTMDDLIWSIKPKNSNEDRALLVKLQPRLIANLREGMESLSVPILIRDDFLSRLVQAHGQLTIAPKEEVIPSVKPESKNMNLENLTIDAWLNFSHDVGASIRAKLSWVSPITGMYLFTDSTGQKYASFTSEQMSELLRLGKAKTLTVTPILSSAIRNAVTA